MPEERFEFDEQRAIFDKHRDEINETLGDFQPYVKDGSLWNIRHVGYINGHRLVTTTFQEMVGEMARVAPGKRGYCEEIKARGIRDDSLRPTAGIFGKTGALSLSPLSPLVETDAVQKLI